MKKCVLCKNIGKQRKFFLKNKLICGVHYIEYLEYLISNMEEKVTTASANNALASLETSLKFKYITQPKQEEELTSSIHKNSFKM